MYHRELGNAPCFSYLCAFLYDIQKLIKKFLWKNGLSEVKKGHIKCLLEKFPQHCRSDILHIRNEHLRKDWKTPTNIVWTLFWGYAQNQCLAF